MIFVLRKLEKQGNINVVMGERYRIIHRKTHWTEFNKIQKRFGPDLRIHAFVASADNEEEGMRIEPLYREGKYYIVTEDGNTFERIVEIT